ncbi:hypothetical protein [Gemmatimonas sp.]
MRTLRAGATRACCAAALVGLAPSALSAQAAPPSSVTAASDSARSPNGSGSRWQFDQCMGGLTYGAPLKWALSYGMGWVRESEKRDWCFLGAGKVGFGGASFSVGVANSMGHFGSGVAVTGGMLRTFNDPMGALAKRTYVGGSVHIWPILALGGEVGYYHRVGTDPVALARGRGMITWSTGFGF